MRNFALLSLALILTGCVSNADRQQTEANISIAHERFRPDVEGKACLDIFKSRMNDPSSFQQAGDFRPYDEVTRLSHNGTVAFVVPVRGKNAMGGLVLKTLICEYQVTGNNLTYFLSFEE